MHGSSRHLSSAMSVLLCSYCLAAPARAESDFCSAVCDGVREICSTAGEIWVSPTEKLEIILDAVGQYIITRYCDRDCEEVVVDLCPNCDEATICALLVEPVCNNYYNIRTILDSENIILRVLDFVQIVVGKIAGYACGLPCPLVCDWLEAEPAGGDICDIAVSGDGICGESVAPGVDPYPCPYVDSDCCQQWDCPATEFCDINTSTRTHGICAPCDGCNSIICESYYECRVLCYNGTQDSGEQGVDCGGPCPTSCSPPAACNDGLRNQGELGVDCGGPCRSCITVSTSVQLIPALPRVGDTLLNRVAV